MKIVAGEGKKARNFGPPPFGGPTKTGSSGTITFSIIILIVLIIAIISTIIIIIIISNIMVIILKLLGLHGPGLSRTGHGQLGLK